MASQVDVADAGMQLLSHVAGLIRKANPNKFTLLKHNKMHEDIYAECEKLAYEGLAWNEVIRALGNADCVRNALLVNEEKGAAGYPESVSLYVEPDRRCLQRVSMMLVSDVWLAQVYGNLVTLMLSALEMHSCLPNYSLWLDPDGATTMIRSLPVVFPRIEITDDAAVLCLTINLGHIASDKAYVEWARVLALSNTKVVRLQPMRFRSGLFAYIRRKLAKVGSAARVLRASLGEETVEAVEFGLSDAEREDLVVSRFWEPNKYSGICYDDASAFESEMIWGKFEFDENRLVDDDPETSGWSALVQPQVNFLRAGVEQGIVRRNLPWPRSIRSARANARRVLESANRGRFQTASSSRK